MKVCSKCSITKTLSSYHKSPVFKDGLCKICKSCRSADAKVYNSKRKAVQQAIYKERDTKWMQKKREAATRYRDKNRRTIRIQAESWRKNNLATYAAKQSNHRAAKLLRTVSWGSQYLINLQYKLAQAMTKLLREPYHVDHITPLQGKTVSGLHVYNNLQVIKGSDNCKKGARYGAM